MNLVAAGQWVQTSFDAKEPKVFTFVAALPGQYTIYLANEDDQDRVTFDIEVDGVTKPKGGLNPNVAFDLQAGNHSAIITARDDSKGRKVMYYYRPGFSKKR
jgi:hypothetical protein